MFSLKSFIRGWDRFFHSYTDAGPLCFFRIVFGFFLLLNGVSLIEDFHEWFGIGDEALVPLMDSFTFYRNFRFNIFMWLPAAEVSAWAVLISYIISSFLIMVGFRTRTSAVICFLLLVSLQNRNYAILNSGDTLMRCMLFLMMFAPSHVKYSVDAWIRKRQGLPYETKIPVLTIRLLKLQFSIVYLATTFYKLKGHDWVDGTAVYYTSRLVNFQRVVLPVIFDYPVLVKISTWGALLIEFAMGTLVWVKEFRIPVLLAGLFLHFMIEVTMSIGFFEWIMMGTYVLFLTPVEFYWLKERFIYLIPDRIRFKLRPV